MSRFDIPLPLQHVAEEGAAAANQFGRLLLAPKARYAPLKPFPSLDGSHSAMSNTPGSRESTESDAGVDRPSGEDSIPEMGEGEKLKQLLKIKRFEQAQLGKAVGVSKNAVGKWTKLDQFSPRTWERVKDGLIKLGLNPHDIRPTAENQAATEDLTKLVERWPREQLIALRRIMVSDEISKALLMAYIDGALRRYSE